MGNELEGLHQINSGNDFSISEEGSELTEEQLEKAIVNYGKPESEPQKAEQVQEQETIIPETKASIEPVSIEQANKDEQKELESKENVVKETQLTSEQEQVKQTQQQQEESAFKKLQEKSGFKTPDDLAKSYENLMKEFHVKRQKEAEERRQQVVSQPTNIQPTMSNIDLNDRIRQDFDNDPLGTMKALVELSINPFVQQFESNKKVSDLKTEIARLSNSPRTADFNDPDIQSQMQEIINSNPEEYGLNMPYKMESIYWQAKGIISAKRQEETKNNPVKTVKKVPIVEGVSKPMQTITETDPNKMSIQDLERLILSKL